MDFSNALAPYVGLWWRAAFLYNPAVVAVQSSAAKLRPFQGQIRRCWFVWNLCFAAFSLLGFLATYRYGCVIASRARAACSCTQLPNSGLPKQWQSRTVTKQ